MRKWYRQRTEPIKSVWLRQPPLGDGRAQSCRRTLENSLGHALGLSFVRLRNLGIVMKVVAWQLFGEEWLIPFHFRSSMFQTKEAFLWLQKKPTDKGTQVLVAGAWPNPTEVLRPKGYVQGTWQGPLYYLKQSLFPSTTLCLHCFLVFISLTTS